MQLVAYGAQDIYLTGNPQITFFKVVYRRHTNFSMESIQQTINGISQVPTTGTASGTVTISRNGDLVYRSYVRMVSASANVVETNAHELISEVELEIGGQRIDRQVSEWLQVWAELTTPVSKANGYKRMTGGTGHWGHNAPSSLTVASSNYGCDIAYVPLQFWFCRNPGLALPLIALQYHEVKLKFTWGGTPNVAVDCQVWCDYIYLDTDERRRFAQVSHEYLIEQIQYQSPSGTVTSEKLNFNHPVKELIWVDTIEQTYDCKTKLQLNNHDRFAAQDKEYFQLKQPYDYHTAIPGMHEVGPHTTNVQLMTSATGLHTDTVGLTGSAATDQSITWVGAAATTPIETSSIPDTAQVVVVSTTLSNAIVVGGVATSAFNANSVKQGDVHEISIWDDSVTTVGDAAVSKPDRIYTNTVKWLGSNLSDADCVVLRHGASLDVTLTTNGENQIANDALLIIYEHPMTIGTLETTKDHTHIKHIGVTESRTSNMHKIINCYSFALKPEEHQPSGTCNFSRIDTAKLLFTGGTGPTISRIYAVNYNVLRIMSGMGGLAYSN